MFLIVQCLYYHGNCARQASFIMGTVYRFQCTVSYLPVPLRQNVCKNPSPTAMLMHMIHIQRVSTNFCLELIEPSAREVFIFWTLVEREERGGE